MYWSFFLLKYQISVLTIWKVLWKIIPVSVTALLWLTFKLAKVDISSLHILKWVSNSFSRFISATFNTVKDPSANSENRVSSSLHGILPDKKILQSVLNRPTKSYQLAGISFESVGKNLSICCTQRHWTQSFRYSLLVLLSLRLFPKWFRI